MQAPNEPLSNAQKSMVAYSRGRPVCRLVDMPELRAAINAGDVRLVVRIALSSSGLGAVEIELAADEEIVSRVQLAFEDAPNEGEAFLIARRATLPPLRITADDPRVAELAQMLVREAVER